ncbi:TBC1 domain family member 1-like [Littorina saxatilis]|uniref:TBC1 domain family member 1-like n=1 Tax=Littorina saxatilis TaxID=31220 RepID=UPI0038B51F32
MEDSAASKACGETEAANDPPKTGVSAGRQVTENSRCVGSNLSKGASTSKDSVREGAECGASFTVWYLGSAIMHRLYTQSLQPWVMAEVKRKRDGIREVTIEVTTEGILRVKGRDPSGKETGEIVLEHRLQVLSRFARLHQDQRCFAYLTRTQLGTDFVCHVYLATTDNTITELFSCIREATRDLHLSGAASNMGEGTEVSDNVKATYEVKYVGRATVHCRKLASDVMDALAERLLAWDDEKMTKKTEDKDRRHRHASGASIKSLPASLDEAVSITENNLGDQLERLRRGANAAASHAGNFNDESGDSSADDLASGGEMSSSENILEEPPHHQQQQPQQHLQQPQPQAQLGHHHHSFHSVTIEKHSLGKRDSADSVGEIGSAEDVFHDSSGNVKASRVMLLQISDRDISLISLDNKLTIFERSFKDIASVSQGNHKKDIFGLIVREPDGSGTVLMAYVLKCHSEAVVNEIMNTLQTAFMSAFQKTSSQQQVCNMCPLHQLHRVHQEITKLSPQAAHELLVKRIQHLPDRDISEVSHRVKMEGPTTYEESVEVMMIALRQLCERRQREHTHVSEGARPSKQDMNLLEEHHKFVLFEGLRNKAKKSLANSFENLTRARKREDARDHFRQRSWTTESETVAWTNRSDSSTPDGSPVTSPTSKHFSHDFPSPPASPEPRKRSSTLGAIPDAGERERAAAKQRLRDVNHNTPKTNSPMKTMYLLSSSPHQHESSSSSPMTSPQDENGQRSTPQVQGSWRKAIFERVCTPTSRDASMNAFEAEHDGHEGRKGRKRTSGEIRALWRKAMLETLLLIRMEKENSDIKARQEEEYSSERKLDYEELTPCLRDVTRVWDDLLNTTTGSGTNVSYSTLLECVKQGVPRNMRGPIWNFLAVKQCRHSNIDITMPGFSELPYDDLLKQLTTHQHAILIDLGRTFPGHPYFAKALGPGQLELFNLLKAYSLLDKEVGYCQGISFIAGVLLMHMEETAAFELTRHLMIGLGLRKQYCPNMMALQVKLYQLMRLIHDQYRDLYNHFEAHEIAPALYATPWFLTLFASQFPLGFVARVFDMIFIQGPDVIFKVGLMLLGSHKELILQCDSFESVVDFLKTTLPEMAHVQMERIINQAFELDISKQLQAYEVEYHVFSEEMIYSPRRNHHPNAPGSGSSANHPAVLALQQTVRRLRQQNLELVEKLQRTNSQLQGLQMGTHEHRVNEDKQKARIQALELERSALLTTVASLKTLIPLSEQDQIPRMLQMQSLSASTSPATHRRMPGGPVREWSKSENNSVSDLRLSSHQGAPSVHSAGDAGRDANALYSDTTDTLCGSSSSEKD